MPTFQDLTGQVFGRLKAVKRVEATKGGTRWFCKCECGNEKTVLAGALAKGITQSCGCLKAEKTKNRFTKHGCAPALGVTAEYRIWCQVKQRTTNPKSASFRRYGGRGIKMSSQWEESFQNFFIDMGSRPSDKHSIERKNNDMGYCKDNCCWATSKEQARNQRTNRLVSFQGVTLTVAEWAESKNMKHATLLYRLNSPKFTLEEAIQTPIGGLRK